MEIPDFGKFTKKEDIEEFIRQVKAIQAENKPREWETKAYRKQRPPDHPQHGLVDEVTGKQCRCEGKYSSYRTWILMTGRGFGKDLELSTKIPTPGGWKEMGQIRLGDEVFDEAGQTCRVTGVFDTSPEKAYELEFSDGTVIRAGSGHQWVTWTHAERKALLRSPYEDTSRFPENWPSWRLKRIKGPNSFSREIVAEALRLQDLGWSRRKISEKLEVSRNALRPHLDAGHFVEREPQVYPDSPGPQVRTTQEIVDTLTFGKRGDTNHCIPTCSPLQLPEVDLPVDPYVLGYWLGDGGKGGSTVAIGSEDAEAALKLLKAADEKTGPVYSDGVSYTCYGLVTRLRPLGVIGNKHVPSICFRASAEQRLALLQGLMDTDGGWTAGNTVEFCNTNKLLADAVVELARTLGQKPVIHEGRAVLDGKDCGPKWRVFWTPTINVFRLPRKADRFRETPGDQSLRNHHRMIVRAEPIKPVPMRCLSVDSPNRMYLAGEGMIPTHNTYAGSNWVLEKGLAHPEAWIACCAPTFSDVKNTCFEGPSGILEQAEEGEVISYNKNDMRITLRNGAIIQGYSADRAESIRGANLSYCWFDEIGIIRYPEFYEAGLLPALRVGERQLLVTTTPRKTKTMRELLDAAEKDPEHVHLTQAGSWENWKSEGVQGMIEQVKLRLHGNQLLIDQELEGMFIEAVPGALFLQEDFDQYRVDETDVPDFRRVVIAVDPAQTSDKKSDETGIIVAAEGEDRHFYCLEDISMQGSPDKVTGEIVKAYHRWQADLVIGEKNAVGDYFPAVLYQKDPHIPFRSVYVMKGKQIRAQPVSVINERGMIHMVGGRDDFSKLEYQLCLAAGTLVRTSRGNIPIEDVIPGDLVLTRSGWKPVTWSGLTGIRKTIRVETDKGSLTCTPDHLIYVDGEGFVPASEIQFPARLQSWQEKSPGRSSSSTTQSTSGTPTSSTSGLTGRTESTASFFTEPSGKTLTDPFQTAGISITGITTRPTITWTTWWQSPPVSTSGHMGYEEPGPFRKKSDPSGRESSGKTGNQEPLPVSTADVNSTHSLRITPGSALITANLISIASTGIAEPVYDITVEGAHEFFANGLLVHNCAMTSFDDRKKVNDDRADAFVFAMRELMGVSSVNYAEVYGFIPCPKCKNDINFLQDKVCKHCGAEVAKREIPQTERVRSAMRWSSAYMRTCEQGHDYSLRFTRCPKCKGDPAEYMKQVAAFAGTESAWMSYSGRNSWLSGRKL